MQPSRRCAQEKPVSKMTKRSTQHDSKARTSIRRSSEQRAGLYGSQAVKPGTRNPSGDTVVQAKPAGAPPHADELSQPGYIENAGEREMQRAKRRA